MAPCISTGARVKSPDFPTENIETRSFRMSEVVVITDSTANLPVEMIHQYRIKTVP